MKAKLDPVLTSEKVLQTLLTSEGKYLPSSGDYMRMVQRELLPQHRKIVTDWMLEVTEEQECSPQVFLSSVQYLDRVLSCLPVKRTQLQLLAAACLLLASKLHDPRPMSLLNLVVYTDCSISVPELQSMEMLVLEKLRYGTIIINLSDSPLDILPLQMGACHPHLSPAADSAAGPDGAPPLLPGPGHRTDTCHNLPLPCHHRVQLLSPQAITHGKCLSFSCYQ